MSFKSARHDPVVRARYDLDKPQESSPPFEPGKRLDYSLTKFEHDAIVKIAEVLTISQDDARKIMQDDARWKELLNTKKRQFDLEMLKYMENVKEAVERKRDSGSLEQMRSGITALAILHDKIFGEPEKRQGVIIGKNIQVNLGWKFTPFRPNKLSTK